MVENGWKNRKHGDFHGFEMLYISQNICFFFDPEKMATGIHTFSLDVSLIEPFFPGHNPL